MPLHSWWTSCAATSLYWQEANEFNLQCFDQTVPSLVRAGAHKECSIKGETPKWSRATCEFRWALLPRTVESERFV
jgi:hypothetical protein